MGEQNHINPVNAASSASRQAASQANRLRAAGQAENLLISQMEAQENFTDYTEPEFNPLILLRNAEPLDKRIKRQEGKPATEAEGDDVEMAQIDAVTKTASEFQNRNPEMQQRALLSLKRTIEPDDGPEEILNKILSSYPDHFLADEALEFLCQTTDGSTKIGVNLRRAKVLLNERFGREIRAGRNINFEANEFAKQGLGTAGSLRSLYKDVTGNPREAAPLFEELSEAYPFEKMKTVLQFLLHSLGSDLKSKGPSIEPGELQRLFTEVRNMQAILGVFRFFFQRMNLIINQFAKEDIPLPKRITFEVLAKLFVKLLAERYPSPDKILRLASTLGLSDELLAQVIIFTQFRDAMRGVAPRLFKSEKHRQDLLMVLIETISELDDLLEEDEEEKEKEGDEEKPKKGYTEEDTLD